MGMHIEIIATFVNLRSDYLIIPLKKKGLY